MYEKKVNKYWKLINFKWNLKNESNKDCDNIKSNKNEKINWSQIRIRIRITIKITIKIKMKLQ